MSPLLLAVSMEERGGSSSSGVGPLDEVTREPQQQEQQQSPLHCC